MTQANRTIAILGMHRSGTSALTGSLEQAGLYIGNTNHKSNDNLKGNRESHAIMTLHNDLLARNGGAWDRPPVRNMRWNPVHHVLLKSIIQNFEAQPIWGFKDPRTLFTAGVWLNTVPTLELVGIFRHPYLVADSLNRRNDIPLEEALDLWLAYNSKLVWLARNRDPFPMVEFSADSNDFNHQLQSLITTLNLPSPSTDFFNDDLRQNSMPEIPMSAVANRCLALYESLKGFTSENRSPLPIAA